MRCSLRVLLSCLTLTCLSFADALATSYTFSSFDVSYSGYTFTEIRDIDNSGKITGNLGSSSGGSGFLKDGKNVGLINYNSQNSWVGGSSSNGLIVGNYQDGNLLNPYGFIYNNGTYLHLDEYRPGNYQDINNNGIIVGNTWGIQPFFMNRVTIINGGIDPLPPIDTLDFSGGATGINDNGVIVGTSQGLFSVEGFIYRMGDGYLSTFSFANAINVYPEEINNMGIIVGHCSFDNNPINYGFVRYANGTVDFIQAFNSSDTRIFGINDDGRLVGTYLDAQSQMHGFVGTPVPVPASIILLGTGLLGLGAVGWRRRKYGQ